MKQYLFILFFFSLGVSSVFAQKPADEGRVTLYRQDISGGIIIHNEGWGGYFRYGRQLTYNKRISYSLDIVTMHHPKEVKVVNQQFNDGKGYFFGKLNAMYIVRPGIGMRHIRYEKIREKGVEISFNYSAGPSLGLLKPVYLQILNPTNDPTQFIITEEKYDPNIHDIDFIYGRAKNTLGLGEMKFSPGVFANLGVQFEYANEDDMIRAIELGGTLDFYFKPVSIMAGNPTQNLFVSLYFKFIFGRKFY